MRLYRVAACLLVATTTAAAPPSSVSSETLLKAINFALEGKDISYYVWKSRPDCVVVADHAMLNFHSVEVIYLNRVDASRIQIKAYSLQNPAGRVENYVKVELHGKA